MTTIQQGRYDQLLRRVADLKGPGSKVNDVLEELFPTFDVEGRSAELMLLSGWRLAMGSTILPAVAANNRQAQLFNPAGSNALVVPTRIWISVSISQTIEWDVDGTALPDFFSTSRVRDTRLGVASRVAAQVRQRTQPGSIIGIGNAGLVTGTPWPYQDEGGLFVLAPGTGLTFSTTTVNSQMIVHFEWRERVAEPSELSF